jgi:integrase
VDRGRPAAGSHTGDLAGSGRAGQGAGPLAGPSGRAGVLQIRAAKGGKDRQAPVSAPLRARLADYHAHVAERTSGEWFSPGRTGQPLTLGNIDKNFRRSLDPQPAPGSDQLALPVDAMARPYPHGLLPRYSRHPRQKADPAAVNHLTIEQTRRLLAQPDRSTRRGRRDATLLATLYDTAARVQELADLTVRDIRLPWPS